MTDRQIEITTRSGSVHRISNVLDGMGGSATAFDVIEMIASGSPTSFLFLGSHFAIRAEEIVLVRDIENVDT